MAGHNSASVQRPPVIMLMGPTASGKTDLAVELVRRFPLEIISVDSALVYKGMDIGTAKPDPNVLVQAPHRLIDMLDPREAYSAAQFRTDALREIESIYAASKVPLLVGGTMLYFRALERGLSDLPEANQLVRERLADEAAAKGWGEMHARLTEVDPVAAARIHPNDPQRIQRALEVYELTGQPLSRLIEQDRGDAFPYEVAKWIIAPSDRRWLHDRIGRRFRQMLDAGFVDEVAALRTLEGLAPELPSMRAVGYRQIWDYLEDRYDYETMTERGIIATRQFAKRQLTWLRSERGADVFHSEDPHLLEALVNRTQSLLG